ncbi:MAG: acyl-CoA dehydrogenase family protein [Caulobacteraceae bacterium]|nr:acyl-CoA dehydrogenase family protein [Caulobacteraceae bacterium]
MHLDLTPQERLFREELRDWLAAHVPRETPPKDRFGIRAFDMAWQRIQYDGGWAGIAWPKEYGGRGLSLVEQVIWYEEAARADAPDARCAFVGLYHGGPTLIVNATEEQKAFHLPKILKGETVWCQGFSEPGAGSDLAGLSTRAEIDGDELVVTGSKIWTSYAQVADYQELLLRTDPQSRRHGGLSWVICDMRAPGVSVRPVPMSNGWDSHLNQVFYDEVRLPLANVVGEVGGGWKVAMSTLSFERGTAFTARQMQIAKWVDDLIERARTRTGPDGRPAFGDDEIGRRLARLRAETAALRAMTFAAVARNERRQQPGPDGSMLKIHLARLSKEANQIARRLMGVDALLMTDEMEEHLYGFAATVGGGTDEIQHNIVAERVLGLPKSY